MSFDTYANLQTEIADFAYRSDLTTKIPSFIALCEADMQIRCKLVNFEASATVTLTSGIGTLPTGFTGMRAVYADGDPKRPLKYLPPDLFDKATNASGSATYYTLTAGTIKVSPLGDGDIVMLYKARFTPLSDSNTSNVILSLYPDAYLHGSLAQLANYTKDADSYSSRMALFEAAIGRIESDNKQRKYAGPLQVRVS